MHLPQLNRIYLEDYQNRTEPALALIRLIASPSVETIALAQELAQQREKLGAGVIDFIETVLVYKLPNLSREGIKTMLALNDIELKQTRFYQEIKNKWR